MRVLSIGQPWATLIVRGVKTFEARTWSTPYRGEIAIHASAGIKSWAREACESDVLIRRALKKAGIEELDDLPRGAVVGTAVLKDIARANQIESRLTRTTVALCGDPDDDDFLWELEQPHELRAPIPIKGKLNLWTLPRRVASRVTSGAVREQ